MWPFKKMSKKKEFIISLFILSPFIFGYLYLQNRIKKHQTKIVSNYPHFEEILNRHGKNSVFFTSGKRDASDIILPLSDMILTSNTIQCKNKIHWSHHTPKLSEKILGTINEMKSNWLDFKVPKEIGDQLIWMDELEGYSTIDFQSSPLAECIVDQIPKSYFYEFFIARQAVIDDYFPPKIYVDEQIKGWIKIALITSLGSEDLAKKSAKRVVNLARILLNSNELYTFLMGEKALWYIRYYLNSSISRPNAKYFPAIGEIEDILQIIHFQHFLLSSVSKTSIDLKAFNQSGTWPGKCANLSFGLHIATISLKSFGVYPYRDLAVFNHIIDYNQEYCPMPHLALAFKKAYLANERSMALNLNWELWRHVWNIYHSFLFRSVYQMLELRYLKKGDLHLTFDTQ